MALIKVKRLWTVQTDDEFKIQQFDLYSDQRERAGETNCYITVAVMDIPSADRTALFAGREVELELEPGSFTQSPKTARQSFKMLAPHMALARLA